MKKRISIFVIASFLLALIGVFPALAKGKVERPKGLEDKGPLSKITFIHYRKAYGKPPWAGGGNGKGESKCYDFLAKGAKWKEPEPYYINPSNDDRLHKDFVKNAITNGVAEWESYGGEIFGEGSINNNVGYNDGDFDGKNTASFGPYKDNNVIAIATVWGYFYGPPKTRELVEWDILFNEYWTWGDGKVDLTLMDLQNIATHELGHSAGMGDLYKTSCKLETMYGYSDNGEFIKRNLHKGDIAGIKELYGN